MAEMKEGKNWARLRQLAIFGEIKVGQGRGIVSRPTSLRGIGQ